MVRTTLPLPIEAEESQMQTHLLTYADRHQHTRTGSLNWGQQEILAQIVATAPQSRHLFNLQTIAVLPRGTSLEQTFDAVRSVVRRHEPLRTAFDIVPASTGHSTQSVVANGTLEVPVVEAEELGLDPNSFAPGQRRGPVITAVCALRCGYHRTFDGDPVRVTVVTHGGAPTHVVFCMSHLVIDGAGLLRLDYELQAHFAGASLDPTPPVQPLTMSSWEQSPAGAERDRAVVAYWRQRLASEAADELHPPCRNGSHPRFPRIHMCSAALLAATLNLAERYKLPPSAITFAAIFHVIAAMSGRRSVLCAIPFSNRVDRRLRRSLGVYSQQAIAEWRLMGARFIDTARLIHLANIRAFRHARYSPTSMQETFAGWGGFDEYAFLDCMVNAVPPPPVAAAWPPHQIRALQTLTSWDKGVPAPESGRYWFWVAPSEINGVPYTKVTFGSVPDVVSVVQMRERLLDVERLCVALAHDEPYELAGLGVVR